MFEEIPDDRKFMVAIPKAILFTKEGLTLEVSTYGNIESADERKERIAEAYGISNDDVRQIDASTAVGRLSVGFSKWHSSWDPHAQKTNPNLN